MDRLRRIGFYTVFAAVSLTYLVSASYGQPKTSAPTITVYKTPT